MAPGAFVFYERVAHRQSDNGAPPHGERAVVASDGDV